MYTYTETLRDLLTTARDPWSAHAALKHLRHHLGIYGPLVFESAPTRQVEWLRFPFFLAQC